VRIDRRNSWITRDSETELCPGIPEPSLFGSLEDDDLDASGLMISGNGVGKVIGTLGGF
jgi:hypothetical protein